jgi:pimeloyl-ACP methyl ester carboxylesterase
MNAPLLATKEAVELSDGRRLSYSATGPRDGTPILYLHGAIGSAPQRDPQLEAAITRFRIRYLMVDRPGFGGSDPKPGRRVGDFAGDLEELADKLRLSRLAVIGVSAGAPYALATARAMADRVAAVASVSTIPPGFSAGGSWRTAPHYRLALMALAGAPRAISTIVDPSLAVLRRRPGALRRLFALGALGGDRDLLGSKEAREIATRRFLAATARGSWPMIEDFLVCRADWGFELAEVSRPIHLWHGTCDPLIPIGYADAMRRELPDVLPRFVESGHFLLRDRIGDILGSLARATLKAEPRKASERIAA